MKFRHYLETIAGVSVYPMFSLLVFVIFFSVLLIMTFRMTRRQITRMANMPLEDGVLQKAGFLPFLLVTLEPGTHGSDEFLQYMLILLIGLVALFIVGLLISVTLMLQKLVAPQQASQTVSARKAISAPFLSGEWFSQWWARFGGVDYAIEDEGKMMLDDHEIDGIVELNNGMPPWLQFLFSTTIVFALIYLIHYHVAGTGDLQLAELNKDIQIASAQKEEYLKKVAAKINENTVTAIADKAQLAEAKSLFEQKCAACHGQQGEGGVGPNLTDEFWLHGGGIHNVFKTIKYGVPDKGMISWEKQMTPIDMQKIASYVVSIKGTNPPNSKAPQGDKYVETATQPSKEVAIAQ